MAKILAKNKEKGSTLAQGTRVESTMKGKAHLVLAVAHFRVVALGVRYLDILQ